MHLRPQRCPARQLHLPKLFLKNRKTMRRSTRAELKRKTLIWLCLRPTLRGNIFTQSNLNVFCESHTIFHYRSKAVKALKNNKNDIVNAIMVSPFFRSLLLMVFFKYCCFKIIQFPHVFFHRN